MDSGGKKSQDDMEKFEEFLKTTKLLKSTDLNDRFIEFLIEVNSYKSKVYDAFKVFKTDPSNANEGSGISFEAVRDYANKNEKVILKRAPKVFANNKYFVERLLEGFVNLCGDQLAIKTQMEANMATLQDNFKKSDTKENDTKVESTTNKTMLEAVDRRDTTLSSAIEVFQSNMEDKGLVVEGQVNLQRSLGVMCFTVSELVEIIKGLLAEKMNLDQEKERLQKDLFAKTEENISIKAKLGVLEEKLALQQKENENNQKLIETQQKTSEQQIETLRQQTKIVEQRTKQVEEREEKVKELQELLEKQQAEIKKQLEDIEKWKLVNKALIRQNNNKVSRE